MRERIAAGKFDRTGETIQPLLKLLGGFCRLLQTHSWTYKGGVTTNWDKTRLVCRMFKKTMYLTRPPRHPERRLSAGAAAFARTQREQSLVKGTSSRARAGWV